MRERERESIKLALHWPFCCCHLLVCSLYTVVAEEDFMLCSSIPKVGPISDTLSTKPRQVRLFLLKSPFLQGLVVTYRIDLRVHS